MPTYLPRSRPRGSPFLLALAALSRTFDFPRPPIVATALALLAWPVSAQAQAEDPFGRFSVGLHLGYELLGPGVELEHGYRAAGYGDQSPGACLLGSCFDGIDYPHGRRTDRPELSAGVNVRVHPSWSVGAAGGMGAAGSVEGYDAEAAANSTSAIFYETFWVGLLGAYHAGRVRLALGPATELTRWTADRTGGDEPSPEAEERSATTSVGYVGEVAITVWSWTRVGAELLVRYRDGGSTRVSDLEGTELPVHSRTLFIGAGLILGPR